MVRELASAYQGSAAHWDFKSYARYLSGRSVTGAEAVKEAAKMPALGGKSVTYPVKHEILGYFM